MWGEFLVGTVGGLGQKTDTATIMQTVSGMANLLGLSYDEPESTFKLTVPDHIRSEFSEIGVTASMLHNGDTLKDIRLPGHTLVVMVCRNQKYFVPKGLTRL